MKKLLIPRRNLLLSTTLVVIFLLSNSFKSLFNPKLAEGHMYYIAANGSDSNDGSSPNTAWQSINKVNSVKFSPGDDILFKRGDTFLGTLNIKQSGEADHPILISAYGNGAGPIISGFVTLANWKKVKNGIYEAPCPGADSIINVVTLNDKIQAMGRYPNSDAPNGGYLTFQSHTGNASITDAKLNGSTNWIGAQIVVRKTYFLLEKSTITNQTNGTITYKYKGDKHDYVDGFGYFIQNDPRTLDKLGEWYFNPSGKTMQVYFGNNSPVDYVMKASVVNNLINLSDVEYITIKGIQFEGSNSLAVNINNSHDVILDGNSIKFSGGIAISINGVCPNLQVTNNAIDQTQDVAINGIGCNNGVVSGNTITNCGMWAGMGSRYVGVFFIGDNALLEHNTVKNSGYNGMQLYGNNVIARNNYIDNFTSVLDDGAGMFLSGPQYTGRKLINNIVIHGIGATKGERPTTDTLSEGIYIDDNSNDITVDGNTVAYVAGDGLKIHNAHNLKITNNTFFDNKDAQILLDYDTNPNGRPIRNITINHNIMVINRPTEYSLKFESIKDDLDQFGTYDNNIYLQPFASQYQKVNIGTISPGVSHHLSDVGEWHKNSGNDANAKKIELFQDYYQLNNQGPNLFGNTNLRNGLGGIASFSGKKDFSISLQSGSIIGNAIQGTVNNISTGDNNIITLSVGPIQANKSYVVNFKVAGNAPGADLDVLLRKISTPYNAISNQQTVDITATPADKQVLLTASQSYDKVLLTFNVNAPANTTFWLNNISIAEANVNFTNPASAVKLVLNPSASVKNVSLNDTYKNLDNTTVGSSVDLQPYASAILFKSSVQSKTTGPDK